MAIRMIDHFLSAGDQLRYQPTPKRVRAKLGELIVVDTTNAALVWEPKRVVPSYAVPIPEITGTVAESPPVAAAEAPVALGEGGPPILDPSTPFAFHTAAGTTMSVTAGDARGQGFRADELDAVLILDFDDFEWWEEEEPIVGHPRDPFSRIDLRQSSRHIRIELDDEPIAESDRPLMLFELVLPARYYLPRADVIADLTQSDTQTVCAYKGHATHWSTANAPDIAWSYETPPPELAQITGLICFYQERVDFVIDGERQKRPVTPWS